MSLLKNNLAILPANRDPVDFCSALLWNDTRGDHEIADDIGISASTVWHWKNNPPLHGRISTVKKILVAYGWEIHYKRIKSK